MTDQIAYRDRDFEFSVYITTAAGVAVDIASSTWTFTLRRNNVEDILVTATPAIGSASGGRLDIAILAAAMTFDGGRLVAELVRTDTGADTYARWFVSYGNPGQVVGGSGDITIMPAADLVLRAVNAPAGPAGAGAGVMTDFTATAWRVFYSDAAGDVTELALGADGTFLKSNGASLAPSFATPAGSGDVAKVGTPVNNQVGIWTGDGTLEGDAALTFDTTTDTLAIAASGNLAFGAVNVLDDNAGTMTLSNIDALDATTEATIEAAIAAAYQPLDSDLTTIAANITAAGHAILDDANAAAQATTLGLGTGDSPQFTGVNVGHATDTTITRSTAGQVAVEGNRLLNVADRGAIGCVIDGGGSAITTGIKGDIGPFTFACTIEDATLLADQSGSIVVDIWKDAYSAYPPTVADTITASAKPTISSAVKSQDSTLTGWTTSISVGDTLRFNVDSVTTITRVTLSMKIKRT